MTIEVAILAPAMMLFVALIVFGGRVAVAQQAIQVAANDAARSASIERTQAEAEAASRRSAETSLASQGVTCDSHTVGVDTGGFSAGLGEKADVRADVSCEVSMGSLTLPGVPGSVRVSKSATSPIDSYRER